MDGIEFKEKICTNCGHKLEFHLEEEGGRCKGDEGEDCQWCIANCERFWED